MKLNELDNGIHNTDDLNKKFKQSYVVTRYGEGTASDAKKIVYIDGIESNSVFFRIHPANNSPQIVLPIENFVLEQDRPTIGIVNAKTRPYKISINPARQWKLGWSQHNIDVVDVKGTYYDLHHILNINALEECFNPEYPSIDEACELLLAHKKKHIAINKDFSILRGKQRLVFLRSFVPFLSYKSKMFFPIPPCNQLLRRECETFKDFFLSSVGHVQVK